MVKKIFRPKVTVKTFLDQKRVWKWSKYFDTKKWLKMLLDIYFFYIKKLRTMFSSYKISVLSKNGVRIVLRNLIKVLETIFCDKQEKFSTFQKWC